MRTVVAYDVSNDARRDRISNVLVRVGDRVQKSVFECTLTSAERQRLLARLVPLLDERSDSIHCYVLCEMCAGRGLSRPERRTPDVTRV